MVVVADGQTRPGAEMVVSRVLARVSLEPIARREAVMRLVESHPRRDRWRQRYESRETLRLHVHLSLETGEGQEIATSTLPDLGVVRAGPVEVAEAIDQLLGRDPRLHRPPKLSWGRVLEAAARAGVRVSERDLMFLPLRTIWDDEARRAASESFQDHA